jgi:hypothetical protein
MDNLRWEVMVVSSTLVLAVSEAVLVPAVTAGVALVLAWRLTVQVRRVNAERDALTDRVRELDRRQRDLEARRSADVEPT